jgi:hypothetical protein
MELCRRQFHHHRVQHGPPSRGQAHLLQRNAHPWALPAGVPAADMRNTGIFR